MKVVWPDCKVLLHVEGVYTIAVTQEDNYVFINCSDRALSIIIDYDYAASIIYSKERIIDILNLFKERGLELGLEVEMWVVKEKV